jgi:hypothetical protein
VEKYNKCLQRRGHLQTVLKLDFSFSAIHVNGKRAYELARKGIEVLLQPRPIHIYKLDCLEFSLPFFKLSKREH